MFLKRLPEAVLRRGEKVVGDDEIDEGLDEIGYDDGDTDYDYGN